MISNVSALVAKTLESTIDQCGIFGSEERRVSKDVAETLNTIVTNSELVTATLSANDEQPGFFSENAKKIKKTKISI